MRRLAVLVTLLALATACASSDEPGTSASSSSSPPSGTAEPTETTTPSPSAPVMPDLVGMPSAQAQSLLGELELGSDWGQPVPVRCEARPRTVARQHPAPGATIEPDTTVHIRTAALDLATFRGPCDPVNEYDDDVAEADAALARRFYRFAADPALGAPFADEAVWVGIEDGPTSTRLGGSALADLEAWRLGTAYAERSGPFSSLDTLAESGGYYALSNGVAATCPAGNDQAPPEMDGLRAISLTAPDDVTSACLEWWGVTLFVDSRDRIRGVALRLGSP